MNTLAENLAAVAREEAEGMARLHRYAIQGVPDSEIDDLTYSLRRELDEIRTDLGLVCAFCAETLTDPYTTGGGRLYCDVDCATDYAEQVES